jgi:two-component system, NarL family, nitrate/nitrite response regulator NarL
MSSIIKIGIIDDHQIVIDGLKLLLNDQHDLQVVKENTDALKFLKSLKRDEVDIILTDIIMPKQMSGVEFVKICKVHYPEVKVMVLSMCEEGKIIHELLHIEKVNGYLSKSASKHELIEAIHKIYNGQAYYSKDIYSIFQNYLELKSKVQQLHISEREKEIIQCINQHLSNKQIADKLFISERTVETHRKNIYRKTNTKGEASLIQLMQEMGIINKPEAD